MLQGGAGLAVGLSLAGCGVGNQEEAPKAQTERVVKGGARRRPRLLQLLRVHGAEAHQEVIVELQGGVRIVALEQNTERARSDDRWELGHGVTVGWLPEHSLVLR